MTERSRVESAKIDAAVLSALGQGKIPFRVIMKRLEMGHSATTVKRSLGRLMAQGKVAREHERPEKKRGRRPVCSYKGHGPEPTVFWRRV